MRRGSWSTFIRASLIGAAGLALAIVGMACGGGEGPALEGYFAELDTILRDTNSQLDSINADFDTAYAQAGSDEEAVSVFLDYVSRSRAVVSDAKGRLEALDPPSEAKDAHEAFVGAVSGKMDLTADLDSKLQDAETTDDITRIFGDIQEEGEAADSAADAACFGLQAIADENNIGVDLKCGES